MNQKNNLIIPYSLYGRNIKCILSQSIDTVYSIQNGYFRADKLKNYFKLKIWFTFETFWNKFIINRRFDFMVCQLNFEV